MISASGQAKRTAANKTTQTGGSRNGRKQLRQPLSIWFEWGTTGTQNEYLHGVDEGTPNLAEEAYLEHRWWQHTREGERT